MTENPQNTRVTLIQRLQNQHDDKAWEEFSAIYSRYIYVIIRRLGVPLQEANELTQTILIKLWQKLPEYKFMPEIAKFRTWLFKVIFNAVTSYKRTLKKENLKTELNEEIEIAPETTAIMESEWENYIANLAWEKVKPLFSGNAVEVFELSIEGKSPEEISSILNLKLNTVYKLRNRFKEKMAQQIEFLKEDLD